MYGEACLVVTSSKAFSFFLWLREFHGEEKRHLGCSRWATCGCKFWCAEQSLLCVSVTHPVTSSALFY